MINATLLATALMLIEATEGYKGKDGDGGKAHGPYQIHDIYLKDVNDSYGTKFTRQDCYDREKAKEIVKLYLSKYATPSRLKREPTVSDLCRIHNGGPEGWREEATLTYWNRCLNNWASSFLKEKVKA